MDKYNQIALWKININVEKAYLWRIESYCEMYVCLMPNQHNNCAIVFNHNECSDVSVCKLDWPWICIRTIFWNSCVWKMFIISSVHLNVTKWLHEVQTKTQQGVWLFWDNLMPWVCLFSQKMLRCSCQF